MSDAVRTAGVGIAGYGFIGKVHTFAHVAMPMLYNPPPLHTKLLGVCAASKETGRKAMEQAGFLYATTDHHELLANDGIDIVHCCTPNGAHFEFLMDALKADKHIYCDKPLARTLAEAEAIAKLAENSDKVCRMTFNYRFIPAVMRAKELLMNGDLGTIYQFRAAYLHAGYVDPARPLTWRLRMSRSGGGAVMDLGVHVFDLMRHLLGDFDKVNATLETVIQERPDPLTGEMGIVDVDDIALARVRMKSGALGTVEATRMATGAQDEMRFEIHGSRGAVSFNMMDPNWLTYYDATSSEAPLGGTRGPQKLECCTRYPAPYALGANRSPIGWPQFHAHCLFDFLKAVAEGIKSGPDFTDGLKAQRIVDACQRSSATGQWVNVDPY